MIGGIRFAVLIKKITNLAKEEGLRITEIVVSNKPIIMADRIFGIKIKEQEDRPYTGKQLKKLTLCGQCISDFENYQPVKDWVYEQD